MTKPTLADGVEFKLGMTIYLPRGKGYETCPTNPEIHEIDDCGLPGPQRFALCKIGFASSIELTRFYSCPENIPK